LRKIQRIDIVTRMCRSRNEVRIIEVYDAETGKEYYFVVDTEGRVKGIFENYEKAYEFTRTIV